jgi:hypothetical protein
MLASKLDRKHKPDLNGAVHMPTIMKNKKMSDTGGGANSMFRLNSSSKGGFNNPMAVPGTNSMMQQDKRIGTAPNGGVGRPKTAGLMSDGFPSGNRPQTGAVGQPNGLPVKNSLKQFAPAGAARAASAGFS